MDEREVAASISPQGNPLAGALPRSAAGRSTTIAVKAAAQTIPPVQESDADVATPVTEQWLAARTFGTRWGKEKQPELAAFSAWAERHVQAEPNAKAELRAEGVRLAQERLPVFTGLIRGDPEAAIAMTVPWTVRQALPPEVQAALEERISARGNLYSMSATPLPGGRVAQPYWQEVGLGNRFLNAHTYGERRERQFEYRKDVGIHGVAVGRELAVLDSERRILDPGEIVPESKSLDPVCATSGLKTTASHRSPLNTRLATANAPVAVDDGSQVIVVCRQGHLNLGPNPPWGVWASGGLANPVPGAADLSKPPTNVCSGVHQCLFIRVDTSDAPGAMTKYPPDKIVNAFMRPDGVNDYFLHGSHGQASVQLDLTNVTPVFRLPNPIAYYKTNVGAGPLHDDARSLATAAGFNVTNYNHVYVLHPNSPSVPGTPDLLGYGGLAQVWGQYVWLNDYVSFGIIAHETGHNFGLVHAHRWAPTNSLPLGDSTLLNMDPSNYSTYNPPTGLSEGYADSNDVMGSGGSGYRAWYNPWFATYVRWLPDSIAPSITESGIYRIYRYDHQNADTNQTLAIKVQRDGIKDYWVAYRRQPTNDTNRTIANGAYIFFGYHSYRPSDWVRMDSVNWALTNGQTLNDTDAGIAFTTIGQGGGGVAEYLDAQVQFVPQIEWQTTNAAVSANASYLTLVLRRSRDFSGVVTVQFQTEDLTAVAGRDFVGMTNVVTWNSGDRSDKYVTVTLSPAAALGGQFRVRLTSVTGGMNRNGDSVTIRFGGLWRQFFANISGLLVRDLTDSPSFPNSPTSESVVTSAEAPANVADNYGQRLIGFITPTVTANYTFWAAGDDDAQVFLGTNATPASRVSIIYKSGANYPRVYYVGSASIPLTAGQRYYFEVLHKEGGGGDHVAVTWMTNSTAQPPNGAEPIPGSVLSYVQGGDFAPRVITGPQITIAAVGGSATFIVSATGASPLSYQWRKDGLNLIGATNASYSISNASAASVGNYDVMVANAYGSVISSTAALTMGSPPNILTQPSSQTIGTLHNVTLSVGASGSSLTYQWRFNGMPLGFATNASLMVPAVTFDQAGNYDVVVANALGFTTSAVATVTVFASPAISVSPVSVAANPGGFAQFGVTAMGEPPLAYQWRKNGTNLSGATFPNLAIAYVSTNDIGNYDVVVSNLYGSITSQPAVLSVAAAGNVALGGLWREVYTGIGGLAVSNLTSATNYPAAPTSAGVINAFEAPINVNDNYGQRISGYLIPPVNGVYNFFLASDDTSELWISTNALSANKVLISQRLSWNPPRQWIDDNSLATPVYLVAGQRYYVEVLHKEGGGGDHVAVTWQTPTDLEAPANGSAPIPGNYLAYDQRILPLPTILAQPVSQIISPGGTAILSVGASNAVGYIWRKNGVVVPGANSVTLTISNMTPLDGGNYDVVVGGLGGTAASTTAVLSLLIAPGITTQPLAQAVVIGGTALFFVQVSGTPPFIYQWLFNGAAVSGATNASYTLPNVQPNQAGNYLVIVTNVAGSATSSSAVLVVSPAPVRPAIVAQPASQGALVGTTVTLSVTVTGTGPLYYQWRTNGVLLADATNSILTLINVQTNQSANYSVVVSNIVGTAISSDALLAVTVPIVPGIMMQPIDQTTYVGATATLRVVASGSAPLGYQWRFNGNNIGGATNAIYTLANVQTGNAGSYTVVVANIAGGVTSSNAVLTVLPAPVGPLIFTQPLSQQAYVGADVSFVTVASGTAPLTYLWRFNNANIPGGNTATLHLGSVTANQAGEYFAIVSNSEGLVFTDKVRLNVDPSPFVLESPQSVDVAVNGTPTLFVRMLGEPPFTYQWRWNGTNLLGATSTNYTLANIQIGQAGGYDVVVTNSFGSVTSAVAVVRVAGPLAITVPLRPQTVPVGATLTLTVEARGLGLNYYWFFKGQQILGASNASLIIPNAQLTSEGAYLAVVADVTGLAVTSDATVTVDPMPLLTQQPANRSILFGNPATFAVSVLGQPPFGYQWRRNSVDLVGETNASFGIAAVGATNAGIYSVRVFNNYGALISSNATLSVAGPPLMLLRSGGQTALTIPAFSSQFVLEFTDGFGPGHAWTPVTFPTGVPGSDVTIQVELTSGARIYRLRSP